MSNINLIGISGKVGSGKDLVSDIIQYLTHDNYKNNHSFVDFQIENYKRNDYPNYLKWKIKKFADAPKEIICILLGCTREQLESQEFKKSLLPEYLCRYNIYKTATSKIPFRTNISNSELQYIYKIEKYHIKKTVTTVRDLLIYLANDVFRDGYDSDIWVNTLFNQYKGVPATIIDQNLPITLSGDSFYGVTEDIEVKHGRIGLLYPNWIITDVRYKNEAEYIKNKGGILIRINRWVDKLIPIEKVSEISKKVDIYGIYPDGSEALIENSNLDNLDKFEYFVTEKTNINNISETDLDDYMKFDHIIENNSFDINNLISKVDQILKYEGLY